MADFTNFTETEIRDWISQGTDTITAPTNLHVALHTSDPGENPDGSTEVSASDYSRAPTTTGTDWNTPTSDSFENASEISFGVATNNWGTVSHVSLWDGSATTDNCLATYALSSSKAINTDDEALFPAGDLSFSVD